MEVLSKVWPQWKVVKELGAGSFGKVCEIERKDIGGTYKAALKVITIPKSQSEVNDVMSEGMDVNSATQYFYGVMEELVKEFSMMEKLKGNTNIVAYEDHEVIPHEEGIGWNILIRMELLTPLTKHMLDHTLTERDVIKLGIDMCKALELCQQFNIIHRDIKPENIMVSQLGDYKLGDFGVARSVEENITNMSKKGTYTYMAPEVYKGQAYDNTVDIYSLGIVLYRLLNNNRTPFLPPAPQPIGFSDRDIAQEKRMSGEALPSPSNGSQELVDIIMKATAYLAKDRYHAPGEMRKDLETIMYGNSSQSNVDDLDIEEYTEDEDTPTFRANIEPLPVPTPDDSPDLDDEENDDNFDEKHPIVDEPGKLEMWLSRKGTRFLFGFFVWLISCLVFAYVPYLIYIPLIGFWCGIFIALSLIEFMRCSCVSKYLLPDESGKMQQYVLVEAKYHAGLPLVKFLSPLFYFAYKKEYYIIPFSGTVKTKMKPKKSKELLNAVGKIRISKAEYMQFKEDPSVVGNYISNYKVSKMKG